MQPMIADMHGTRPSATYASMWIGTTARRGRTAVSGAVVAAHQLRIVRGQRAVGAEAVNRTAIAIIIIIIDGITHVMMMMLSCLPVPRFFLRLRYRLGARSWELMSCS